MKIISDGSIWLDKGDVCPFRCQNCGLIQQPVLFTTQDGGDYLKCAMCDEFTKVEDATEWGMV